MNVVVEPVMGYLNHNATARSDGVLRQKRSITDVCLQNHSAKQITMQKQTAVGESTAANVILALVALKLAKDVSDKGEATAQKGKGNSQKGLLDIIDLTGLKELGMDEQKEAQDLLTEYTSIFVMSDMDMGNTSLVKHSTRFIDNTPIKKIY